MYLKVLARLSTTLAGGLLGWVVGLSVVRLFPLAGGRWWALGFSLLGALVGLAAAPILIIRPVSWYLGWARRASPSFVAATVTGLVIGLLVAALLTVPLSSLPGAWGAFSPLVASIILGALGASFLAVREREVARILRHVLPRLQKTGLDGLGEGPHVLLDTSAIIDGRIADVGKAGFLPGTLVIPRFVLDELRHVADSSDSLLRNRGRHGLEVLNKLRREAVVPVEIVDIDVEGVAEVDAKLVKLASQLQVPIVTTDFNLNRVAELQRVRVLNVNELSNVLRPSVLPGEGMSVQLVQEGKEPNQALAFLDDGTMVVVDGGRRFIGNRLEVVVTRVLQTAAGRIVFSHPKDA